MQNQKDLRHIKFSVNIDEETARSIDRIASMTDESYSQVLNRVVKASELLMQEEAAGRILFVTDPDFSNSQKVKIL